MDNFFQNCPAIMSDGRLFTEWRSDVLLNENIKDVNNVVRDDDYRILLQKNADAFMNQEWMYISEQAKCNQTKCVHKYSTRMPLRYLCQEMNDYNARKVENCPVYNDYRLTITN